MRTSAQSDEGVYEPTQQRIRQLTRKYRELHLKQKRASKPHWSHEPRIREYPLSVFGDG